MSLIAHYLPPTAGPLPFARQRLDLGPAAVPVEIAVPTAAGMSRLVAELRDAHEHVLAGRRTVEIVNALGRTAERWLDPEFPARAAAARWLPRLTGYASGTIGGALDMLFDGLRAPALWALIEEELGDADALDRFVVRRRFRGRCRAYGPRLTVLSCAGNIPVASLPSLVHALLLKSACLVRVARAEPLLPALFAQSLAAEAPWLGRCLAVVWWAAGAAPEPSGTGTSARGSDHPAGAAREQRGAAEAVGPPVVEGADAWIGYGSDETLAQIRRHLPERVLFQGHGHRLGFAVIARECLDEGGVCAAAAAVARDLVEFDQQGCVSPRLCFVEEGGVRAPLDFARALAERLEALRASVPRRPLTPDESAAIHQQRAAAEMRHLAGAPIHLFRSAPGTEWTVLYDPTADLAAAGAHRTAIIRPVAGMDEVRSLLAPYRGALQTAAIGAGSRRWPEIADTLGAAGVTRLCPLGQTQRPSPGWHHDGRPRLADLVRWVDWEESGA